MFLACIDHISRNFARDCLVFIQLKMLLRRRRRRRRHFLIRRTIYIGKRTGKNFVCIICMCVHVLIIIRKFRVTDSWLRMGYECFNRKMEEDKRKRSQGMCVFVRVHCFTFCQMWLHNEKWSMKWMCARTRAASVLSWYDRFRGIYRFEN